MYHVAEAFARWIAPILAFTADELWAHLPPPARGEREGNVLLATWYQGLSALPDDAPLAAADFERLLALRDRVAKVLEPMRAGGEIGAALEAEIVLGCGVADQNWLAPLAEELRFLFISGDVALEALPGAGEIQVRAFATAKPKCVRCWHHRADVGSVQAHPQLCARCVGNIEGRQEDRRWF
jgi:isoleucyl-tRNA synthetase